MSQSTSTSRTEGRTLLSARERAAVEAFVDWLRTRFGARLETVVLFGSRARGEGDEESDVDLLVTVRGLTSRERREVARQSGDAMTDHDVILSPFTVSSDRWAELRRTERRIAREIEADGVPL